MTLLVLTSIVFEQLIQNSLYSSEAFCKLERAYSKRVDQVQPLTAQLKSAEEDGAASKKEAAESNA